MCLQVTSSAIAGGVIEQQAQFACFNGTKVQILTQQALLQGESVCLQVASSAIAGGGVIEQQVQFKANDYFVEPPKLAVAYTMQGVERQVLLIKNRRIKKRWGGQKLAVAYYAGRREANSTESQN